MKTIIVATDFSSTALNAAKYASDMAVALNANILLINIYQVPVIYIDVPLPMYQTDIEQRVRKSMDELKEDLLKHTQNKIAIETEIVMGVFFEELKTISDNVKPYVVVMGSQGTTAAERFFLGGHAVHTMRNLQWPIITIPPETKFSGIKKIGLASDFDKVIETTPVDAIKMFVKDFNSELHILNTGKEKEFNPDVVFGSGMLQEMIFDFKPHYHFITKQDTIEGIMELAKANDIDLLVILPKEHGIMEMITHKSHTKKLVLNSYIPVMALHN